MSTSKFMAVIEGRMRELTMVESTPSKPQGATRLTAQQAVDLGLRIYERDQSETMIGELATHLQDAIDLLRAASLRVELEDPKSAMLRAWAKDVNTFIK